MRHFATESGQSIYDPTCGSGSLLLKAHDLYGRFEYGTPPEKNGDYTFLLHRLKSLKSTGKAAASSRARVSARWSMAKAITFWASATGCACMSWRHRPMWPCAASPAWTCLCGPAHLPNWRQARELLNAGVLGHEVWGY